MCSVINSCLYKFPELSPTIHVLGKDRTIHYRNGNAVDRIVGICIGGSNQSTGGCGSGQVVEVGDFAYLFCLRLIFVPFRISWTAKIRDDGYKGCSILCTDLFVKNFNFGEHLCYNFLGSPRIVDETRKTVPCSYLDLE